MRDVVTYFGVIGYAFDPMVEIEFGASLPQDHVWFRAHGWFDARALTVRLNDSGGFLAWGVRSRGLLAKSFLTHELVHLALHLILGARDLACRFIGMSSSLTRFSLNS